jgi:hypothetical protein
MSVVKLVLRDDRRDLHGEGSDAFAACVVAALCDDPETIPELQGTLRRFVAPRPRGYLEDFTLGLDVQPAPSGVVLVDLAARLVVWEVDEADDMDGVEERSDDAFPRAGCVAYLDGEIESEIDVAFHLSDDWLVTATIDHWEEKARQRRAARRAQPPHDARAVLYGEPLLEFVLRECLDAFGRRPLPDPDSEEPAFSEER